GRAARCDRARSRRAGATGEAFPAHRKPCVPGPQGRPGCYPGRRSSAASIACPVRLAFAPRTRPLAGGFTAAQLLDHAAPFIRADSLVTGPPLAQPSGILAGFFTQQQEIVGGAKARVLQHLVGAPAGAPFQTGLHVPDLPQRNTEALGDGGMLALIEQQFMGGLLLGGNQRDALVLEFAGALGQGWPEQGGEQEGRSNRAALLNAVIGVAQGLPDQ